jgi:hypothetical protein
VKKSGELNYGPSLKKSRELRVKSMSDIKIVVDEDGNKKYYLGNDLHREDGPALEFANGTKHWFKDDKLHRDDGPAIEFANGDRHWYKEGKKHREDGPAIEYANGTKHWYKEDKLHREDGPAVENANGDRSWFLFGQELSEEEWRTKMWSIIEEEQGIESEIHV